MFYENLKNKAKEILAQDAELSSFISSFDNFTVLPGFVDVHVHLREPGYSYKETIKSGTLASARGGYTEICSMPNLSPTPDNIENLKIQLDIIERDAVVGVHPYATITKGQKGEELSDMEALAPFVSGFSDDGRGVQSEEMMLEAMKRAKALSKIIVAHCEDNSLLRGGYIHDGAYARANGHKGICSESEWGPIKRDIDLIRKTDCAYHVCHISTKESVSLIRQAKKEGLNITCETAPHYLLLNDGMLKESGSFKMNPPIRAEEDRQALLEGICDGTIDMIATDHAPHSEEEKLKGLAGSVMGIVGVETAFPLLYTNLVKKNIISMDKLIKLMSENPSRRFNIPLNDSFSVWDLNERYMIDPNEFLSKGRSTPFEGEFVYGRNILTVRNGKIVLFNK